MNNNGQFDVYEDSRQPKSKRIEDILSQMTVPEKAGMMFVNSIGVSTDGGLQELPNPSDIITIAYPSNSDHVVNKLINHFNVIVTPEPQQHAKWYNSMQKLAEGTRLGILITIATQQATQIVWQQAFVQAGIKAQRKSLI